MSKTSVKRTLIPGLYFGLFQAGMPLIGYLLARQFADRVTAYSPWIAFVILSFLGGKMLIGALKKRVSAECQPCKESSLSPAKMFPLATATSIDALAVGVSFAFLYINIVSAVSLIGVTTLALSIIGVKIGNIFGVRFKSKAELLGGIILVAMGLKILLEHLW